MSQLAAASPPPHEKTNDTCPAQNGNTGAAPSNGNDLQFAGHCGRAIDSVPIANRFSHDGDGQSLLFFVQFPAADRDAAEVDTVNDVPEPRRIRSAIGELFQDELGDVRVPETGCVGYSRF